MTVGARSPILGYNHNLKHRGLEFHVQTEDSGVANPHVFTHLFRGGVIIKSRKLEYDADAAADVVKSLMQAQHKRVMKGLRKGEYDDKIDAYLGNEKDLLPRKAKADSRNTLDLSGKQVDLSGPQRSGDDTGRMDSGDRTIRLDTADISAGDQDAQAKRPPPPPAVFPTATPSIPTMKPVNRPPRRFPRPGTASRTRITPAPPPVASSRPTVPRIRTSGQVLVSSPPIVVKSSGTPTPSKPAQAASKPPARTVRNSSDSIFNQNLITEKSLDEVILAYLSEDAED